MAEMETVNVRVCRDCGARYATPGAAALHKRSHPDHTFKTMKEKRPKRPSTISYQPGYGPRK